MHSNTITLKNRDQPALRKGRTPDSRNKDNEDPLEGENWKKSPSAPKGEKRPDQVGKKLTALLGESDRISRVCFKM